MALAALLAGLTLTLCIAQHRLTPDAHAPADQPASPAEPEIELTGMRRTAAERYRAALQRQGVVVSPPRSATMPTVAPDVQVLFHHKEGFPKAWLAPDERYDWQDAHDH